MAPANNRIQKDVKKLIDAGYKLEMNREDDMHGFTVEFHGPEDTLYHGYMWKLNMEIPVDYPFKPPSVHFSDKIYHPNINFDTGGICVNLLDESSWSPACTDLVDLLQYIIPELLRTPNPDDPFNVEAAGTYLISPTTYEARVRALCAMHATKRETSIPKETSEEEIEETSEDDMLSDPDGQIAKLASDEGIEDNVSKNASVFGKADDP